MRITPNFLPLTRDQSQNNRFRQDTLPPESDQSYPERIELVRSDLMDHSNAVRVGLDPVPQLTARRLADMALLFSASGAPHFEQSATLTQTYGNLLAGEVSRFHLRKIRKLARNALRLTYPPNVPDQFTRRLNNITRKTYHLAARITSPEKPFSLALEEAWEQHGMPIDPLIHETEEKILAVHTQQYRHRVASETTGAFTPPDFDD